jgi:hypothetical protein
MTDDQLDAIEAALGVRLPAEYRRVSREFPFQPMGRDSAYWFYDDPAAVINTTRAPLGGEYAGPDLLPRYVVIGDGPAGDAHLLDTEAAGAPVPVLSHETHAVEPEWPTFSAFVAEWVAAPAEWERKQAAERAVLAAWWRRYWVVAGVIALFAFVLPLAVILLVPRR